jgi:hypothetical protein
MQRPQPAVVVLDPIVLPTQAAQMSRIATIKGFSRIANNG